MLRFEITGFHPWWLVIWPGRRGWQKNSKGESNIYFQFLPRFKKKTYNFIILTTSGIEYLHSTLEASFPYDYV